MNLFTTSDNTKFCVQSLDDVLLRKTIVESAQMLSTAILLNDKIKIKPENIYKKYNANEEHNVWVRTNKSNYKWTLMYLIDALMEYNYRFNKNHETWNVAQILTQYENNFEEGEMTDFPRKFNQSYENYDYLMNIKNTFQAYKEYLNTKWKVETKKGNVPMWTKRNKPEFYIA